MPSPFQTQLKEFESAAKDLNDKASDSLTDRQFEQLSLKINSLKDISDQPFDRLYFKCAQIKGG